MAAISNPLTSISANTTSIVATLHERQKRSLIKLLGFNVDTVDGDSGNMSGVNWSEQWKVLIYDRFGRDIISPIIKLHELRKQGVTLHMLVDTDREEIPDVPAIYFVNPTLENIEKIVKDCSRGLYQSAHLNFISPMPRDILEHLAKRCIETNTASMISRIYDQYLGFVSLEPHLFTLNQPQSYLAYNNPSSLDTQIEANMDNIVKGLFSVLATLGVVPVIRCPPSEGPSRMVAERLHSMIKDHLVGKSAVFNDTFASSGFQRPVLIIMDRNEDLASALHHPSTYQALVDDLLKINMNRVKIQVASTEDPTSKTNRVYDLDVKADSFFQTHSGDLFPDAIAANESEMKDVTKKEETIRSRASGGTSALGDGTKGLVEAVDTLPALMEMKKMLEAHTNIFQATFEAVAQRHIPTFSMLEQKLIDGNTVDRAKVLQLLSDPEKGSIKDKLRLMMIYYLTTGVSASEMSDMELAIQQVQLSNPTAKDDLLKAWKYIRQQTSFTRHASVGDFLTGSTIATPPRSGNAPSISMFKDLAGNLAGQAQGFLAQATERVKNFLPENRKLHVTSVTDSICDIRSNSEDDTYIYLDPKVKATGEDIPRHRTPFREAIVFMIGGGTYNEYQNLQAYSKARQNRNVIYGCTEIFNSEEFIDQLKSLGQ